MKIRMNKNTAENGATELQNATKQEKQTLAEMTELRDKRGIRSKHFTDGKGKMAVEIFDRPVHYYDYDADEYKDVDVRFEDKGDVLETRANTFRSRFHKHARNGEIFEVERDNCRLTLKSLDTAQLHACECGEENCTCNKVKYTNVLPDTDIEYTVDVERIKEDIIVKERKDKYEYDFELALENLNVELSEDGERLELTEKTSGGQQFYIPAPMMFDANGNRSDDVYYDVERVDDSGLKIKVIADAEWINAEDRAFPVTIDPQVVTYDGVAVGDGDYSRSVFVCVVQDANGNSQLSDPRLFYHGNSADELTTSILIIKNLIPENIRDNVIQAEIGMMAKNNGMLNGLTIGGVYCAADITPIYVDITDIYKSDSPVITMTNDGKRGEKVRNDAYFYPPRLRLTYGANVKGLSIGTLPNKTKYKPGETFDPTGMKIWAFYEDGIISEISNGALTWPTTPFSASDTKVRIRLIKNTSIYVDIPIAISEIEEKKVTGIEIIKAPNKTEYKEGEEFDSSGMEVVAIYSDGSTQTISPNDITIKPSGALSAGTTYVEISYEGFTIKQTIIVTLNISTIEITKLPQKVDYFEGESFEPYGMVVRATYANGTVVNNIPHEQLTIEPSGALSETNEFVTIGYGGLSVQQSINVIDTRENNLARIEVTKLPNKMRYMEGEVFDPTGMVITAHTRTNKSVVVTDYEISPTGRLALERKTINVSYNGKSKEIRITVIPCVCVKDVPATEQLNLVDSIKGNLYLGTGEIRPSFTDIVDSDGKLSFGITHTYTNTSKDNNCGSGWRLNLHSTLLPREKNATLGEYLTGEIIDGNSQLNDKVDYIYTDGAGNRYAFDEYFYWMNDTQKQSIEKSEVKIDLDGNLYYENGSRYSVTRELKTITGMKLITKLDGISGLEKIDQRHEEIAKLESEIQQYKDALIDLDYNINKMKDTTDESDNSSEPDTMDETEEEYIQVVYDRYIRQRAEYNNALEQKQRQLEAYKRQAPIAYLVSDDKTLCFNEYGNLCGIVDSYGNCVTIIWGEALDVGMNPSPIMITSVNYSDKELKFKYDWYCNIKSITDENGKGVEYEYNDRTLRKVVFTNGEEYNFEYDESNQLISITSKSTSVKAELTYSDCKLSSITQKTGVARLADSEECTEGYPYTVSQTTVSHNNGVVEIMSDGISQTYYLDYYGNVSASIRTNEMGIVENHVYHYKAENGYKSYTVREVGESIDVSDYITLPNQHQARELYYDLLPDNVTNFVFSAEARITDDVELKDYNEGAGQSESGVKLFRLAAATVDNWSCYAPSFDYRNHRAQYVSLPITLDQSDQPPYMYLSVQCDYNNVQFSKFRLAPAEWSYSETDLSGLIRSEQTSPKLIAPGVYQHTETEYEYDKNDCCICERTKVITSGNESSEHVAVKKYSYCEHGNIVKTESYVEGEENSSGINITERVCDDKGNVVKEFSYNSLDSSTKFYKESIVSDKGVTTAQVDETGENKTEIEYVDGTNTVRSQTLPNGSKLAYGYDGNGNVTAITQSTAEGEGNSTEINYTLGCPTRLKSGNNTVFYEYDYKRRKTKVTANGNETAYEYSESISAPHSEISGITFNSTNLDLVKTTANDVANEVYTDKRGNIVRTTVNGNVTSAYKYDADNRLTESGDSVTDSVKKYEYNTDGTKALKRVDITSGENVESLSEEYKYNNYGQVVERAISGTVKQTYTYDYKNNAARDLESIGLPNGLKSYPQKDVNGRNTGKELKDGANNVYAEYIYYRKVGDHGTNMPSSIYFGKNKNGQYSVSDNIKYKYDEMGNISEVRENGVLVAKYAYDKIGRLVREDNRKLNKTNILSYDVNGNILSKRDASYTLKPTDEIEAFTDEKLYAYDGDKLLSFGNEKVSYTDSEGYEYVNPLQYRGNALTWNFGRQLASFGDTQFGYDGYGRRIKKNDTVFIYDANNKLVKQSDGTNTLEFIYDNSGLSGVTYGTTQYIYCKDVQGNIVGILDKDGKQVVQYNYDAWGVCQTNVLDETHAAIAELNPFRYRSYYLDIETNLYYLQTRYYDPEVGRFISQDDVSYLDPEHVNGLNLFAYCGNNPVMRSDNLGTNWWTDFWNGIGGDIVKVALGVAIVVGLGVATVFTGGAVGAIIGAAFVGAALAGISSCVIAIATEQSFTDFANSFLGGVIVGGISGAISGIGAPLGGGLLASAASSVVQSALFQAGANALLGGSYYVISSLIAGEQIGVSNLMFATIASGLGALIPGGLRGIVISVAVDYLSTIVEGWLSRLPF